MQRPRETGQYSGLFGPRGDSRVGLERALPGVVVGVVVPLSVAVGNALQLLVADIVVGVGVRVVLVAVDASSPETRIVGLLTDMASMAARVIAIAVNFI